MAMEQVLHMVGGSGETSYASNSKFQEKSLRMVLPIMDHAIEEVCKLLPEKRLVVVDLGSSSGPNTFLVVSEVLKIVENEVSNFKNTTTSTAINPLEIQFYLNDLPGNDFNQIFQSLDQFKQKVKEQMSSSVPYYIAGLPGTFHGRLLPHQSVHFFTSSMSVQYLSQMPRGIEGLNKKNIYIAKSSPPQVLKVYQEQHRRDFSCFLKCRHAELDDQGRMLLLLPGRKDHDQPYQGLAYMFQLLAQVLYDLVLEGIIGEEKLDNFNAPFYCPSMEEMEKMIESEGLFAVEQTGSFEMNWDPTDESEDDHQLDFDAWQSGKNIAKYARAVFGVLIAQHFGEDVVDEAFSRYAVNVSRHLLREKTKHLLLFILLKKLK